MRKLAVKTVKARILSPTKRKEALLKAEFEAFQGVLRGGEAELYSATRQQAERLRKRINGRKAFYPLVLRRDTIKLSRKNTKLARYWLRVPVFGIRGGIWLPIRPHCEIPEDVSIRETKIVKKKRGWFAYITISQEVEVPEPQGRPLLAVDLGEKYLAVVCGDGISPKFYGKEARGIRRHYAWLRRRLGKRKLLKVIRRIGRTERRKIDAVLHRISRRIVDEAKAKGAAIVLGELKGIRKKAKGKRMNRIVSFMPYYRLSFFIQYKALWEGIPVVKVKEAYTSKTCHRCGFQGSRPYRGLFVCHNCGLRYNADLNGALNILERARGYIPPAGAALTQPLTSARQLDRGTPRL